MWRFDHSLACQVFRKLIPTPFPSPLTSCWPCNFTRTWLIINANPFSVLLSASHSSVPTLTRPGREERHGEHISCCHRKVSSGAGLWSRKKLCIWKLIAKSVEGAHSLVDVNYLQFFFIVTLCSLLSVVYCDTAVAAQHWTTQTLCTDTCRRIVARICHTLPSITLSAAGTLLRTRYVSSGCKLHSP